MADQQLETPESDYDYLWILPETLELTTKARKLLADPTSIKSDVEKGLAVILMYMSMPKPIALALLLNEAKTSEPEIRKRQETHREAKDWPPHQLLLASRMKEVFHDVGMDFKGGIRALESYHDGFPMRNIIVTTPDLANQYFDIGVKVDPQTLLHDDAWSLEESVTQYSRILQLVKPKGFLESTLEQVEKKINDAVQAKAVGKNKKVDYDLKLWELRRLKFRLQVKERHREVVIRMANNEAQKTSSESQETKKRSEGFIDPENIEIYRISALPIILNDGKMKAETGSEREQMTSRWSRKLGGVECICLHESVGLHLHE